MIHAQWNHSQAQHSVWRLPLCPAHREGAGCSTEPAEPDARSHAGRSSDSGLRARCFCTVAGAALSPPPQGYFIAPFKKKCFLVKLEYAMRRQSFVAEI